MNTVQKQLGIFGVKLIKFWVRLFGKTVMVEDVPWLSGPIGPDGEIGKKPYETLAQQENLTIENDIEGSLVTNLDLLASPDFDVSKCDPNVRHFYENTAKYDMEVWSETRFPGRLLLWLLVSTVSRYMNQLNFPVFGLDMSKGMSSEIISLKNAKGEVVHTGWFRQLKESGRVIYTGFYSEVSPPKYDGTCVKVVFPLPQGNATVILKPTLDEKNQFHLRSAGKSFGDSGFYRVVALDSNRLKVLYLKSLKEKFTVYTDTEGVLRCDHKVNFMGMLILRLHYKINLSKVD